MSRKTGILKKLVSTTLVAGLVLASTTVAMGATPTDIVLNLGDSEVLEGYELQLKYSNAVSLGEMPVTPDIVDNTGEIPITHTFYTTVYRLSQDSKISLEIPKSTKNMDYKISVTPEPYQIYTKKGQELLLLFSPLATFEATRKGDLTPEMDWVPKTTIGEGGKIDFIGLSLVYSSENKTEEFNRADINLITFNVDCYSNNKKVQTYKISVPWTYKDLDVSNLQFDTYAQSEMNEDIDITNHSVVTDAIQSTNDVALNGSVISFDAYMISGHNYIKLRDVAMALNGTEKQFEVTWDNSKKAINLLSNKPYTAVGGELAKGDGIKKNAEQSNFKVYLDGKEIVLTAYTINGNTFYQLRDLGKAIGFYVGWDGTTNTVSIDTSRDYIAE